MIKQRKLNPIEATAYWWVNNIKNKIKELYNSQNKDEKEREFLELFYQFNDLQWRELYLELVDGLSEKIITTLAFDNSLEYYQQETTAFGHDDINEVLNKVVNKDIPDINLALQGIGDSIICTNTCGADRVFAEGGISSLDTDFDSNYILSGDMQEFEIKSIIMMLLRAIINNNSFEKLKRLFMAVYFNLYPDCDRLIIEEEFARIFDQLCDEKMINSLSYKKDYQTKLSNFDLMAINCLDCVSPLARSVKELCKKEV